jgi:hypothetical protein
LSNEDLEFSIRKRKGEKKLKRIVDSESSSIAEDKSDEDEQIYDLQKIMP